VRLPAPSVTGTRIGRRRVIRVQYVLFVRYITLCASLRVGLPLLGCRSSR
jgi:hypothetical protein